jgi:hypothetical protein
VARNSTLKASEADLSNKAGIWPCAVLFYFLLMASFAGIGIEKFRESVQDFA